MGRRQGFGAGGLGHQIEGDEDDGDGEGVVEAIEATECRIVVTLSHEHTAQEEEHKRELPRHLYTGWMQA